MAAEAHLRALPRHDLTAILAEWQVAELPGKIEPGAFYSARNKVNRLSNDALVERIRELAARQRSRGRDEGWLCPTGCHRLPPPRACT